MRKRILFVDDDPALLDWLRRMLRGHEEVWDMVFVSSAEEALMETRSSGFDAVVSDVKMPGKDGFELLKALGESEQTKDIPVIIVTGAHESGVKRRALDQRAADLLNKPIDFQDLLARLRSVLRLKSYQDELKARNETLEEEVKERTIELEGSRLDIIWRLGKAAEFRDEATGNHVMRVGCYCRAIAETLGMERDFVEMLFLASPLHDIGKIGIPDHILLKPGALTSEEREVMKQHCAIGAAILRQDSRLMKAFLAWRKMPFHSHNHKGENPILKMASSIALTHHEKWDGTGYPSGLAGEQIPLESRIVALSDVYDALRSHRPNHSACSEDEAVSRIKEGVGRHFDPAVHAAFEKSIEEIRSIRSQLSDEEISL